MKILKNKGICGMRTLLEKTNDCGLLLGIRVLLILLSEWFPQRAEWHSVYVYKILVAVRGRFSGFFLTASVLIFLFVINCGINCRTVSFSEKSGFMTVAYTIEDLKNVCIPFTACHELSHLRGFMQEEEANFIAFLACKDAGREDFQYSGYLLAWIYCMNELNRNDRAAWQEVRSTLDEKVNVDLRENSQFWAGYEGIMEEVSDKVNDTYLKANGQSDGVLSYDRMVNLVVSYYLE